MLNFLTRFTAVFCLASILTGCAASDSYLTPSEPANLSSFTDAPITPNSANAANAANSANPGKPDYTSAIDANFKSQPAARFPARIALMQVQHNQFSSAGAAVSLPQKESLAAVEKHLTDKKVITGIANLNNLLIDKNAPESQSIRLAASRVKADILVLYTLDTKSLTKDFEVGPLNLLLLGFVPNRNVTLNCKASAVVIDVRSGFVYGLTEADGSDWGIATVWNESSTTTRCSANAENQALTQLWIKGGNLLETLAANQSQSKLTMTAPPQ